MTGDKLILSAYRLYTRETRSHGWKVANEYQGNRPNDTGRGKLRKEEVPFPYQVMDELKERITRHVDTLVGNTWSDHQELKNESKMREEEQS
ncbi:hypothetical protein [Paenibacillus xylanexedens]|uniref:Uncharacterized protein n=1 Tax=Paenibacillus xylanexedens TaxID=528191 RepID=A0ABS4RSN5_PAEXY|nr:hypothetical protein [Paenibacillus xylanexedens]MBP2245309.1 hypothetical protein [Paenibacillus xylanexedens]